MARRRCVALTAALFHVLNHALFKSILFFGAGAVLTATGERNMDRLAASSTRCRSRVSRSSLRVPLSLRCRRLMDLRLNGCSFKHFAQSRAAHWGLKLLLPAVGALLALRRRWRQPVSCVSLGLCFSDGRAPWRRNVPSRSMLVARRDDHALPSSAFSPGFCRAS